MVRVRRRRVCHFIIDDEVAVNVVALLRGSIEFSTTPQCALLCPVTGMRIPLDARELAFITEISSSEWHHIDDQAECSNVDVNMVRSLAERGAVISDLDTPLAGKLRKGEERLHDVGWHPQAAIFHAMTQWRGQRGDEAARDHSDEAHSARLTEQVEERGLPPDHFPKLPHDRRRCYLPAPNPDASLRSLLHARRTTRHFRRDTFLPQDAVATVLHATFGALGIKEFAPGVSALRRSSPSGGGLHPIEAFVLALGVEELGAGSTTTKRIPERWRYTRRLNPKTLECLPASSPSAKTTSQMRRY